MTRLPIYTRAIIILLCFGTAIACSGQMTMDSTYTIETKDKQKVVGKLVKITPDSITLANLNYGIISVSRGDIKKMGIAEMDVPSKNYSSEPYYIPTGQMSGKGNHYYRNYFLFVNDFHYGVTDDVDLSFGFEVLSPLANSALNNGFSLPVMQVGGKFAVYQSDDFNVAVASKILANNFGGAMTLAVPFTYGGRRTNATIAPSIVKAFGDDQIYIFPSFNFNISLSRRLRIVTDAVRVDGILAGTTMLEVDFKGKFSMLYGVAYGFGGGGGSLGNIALTIPFGKW